MPSTKGPSNILFVTSTFPASDTDPVPAFIKDEAVWFKKMYPDIKVSILAPHNAYSPTSKFSSHKYYDEYRFHYFWPFRWEILTGRGIQPALKKNKLLYFQLPGFFIAEFFAVWRYTRQLKPDLIYAHWFTPQAIMSAIVSKITGVPFVFDTQASDVIVLKRLPFARKLVSAVCERARAYTAPSQQTVDKLLYFATDKTREMMTKKLYKIPLGTTPAPVRPAAIKAARDKFGLKDKKVIYFIGRLVDRKGVDVLINAFADMSKRDPNLRLVIVGDGQERENFEQQAKKLGLYDSVIFTGFIAGEERFALLNLADVAVVPSINVGDHAEGLPIVFMEGITCGKIMVISDVTGAHEYVSDGKNAFIAKSGSVDDLRGKLEQALKVSERGDKEFAKAVTELAKKFQWPTITKQRYEAFTPKDN